MYEYVIGAVWDMLWMILVWTIPALLAVMLIVRATGERNAEHANIALQILEARHARGAIDRTEYLKNRRDLLHRSRGTR